MTPAKPPSRTRISRRISASFFVRTTVTLTPMTPVELPMRDSAGGALPFFFRSSNDTGYPSTSGWLKNFPENFCLFLCPDSSLFQSMLLCRFRNKSLQKCAKSFTKVLQKCVNLAHWKICVFFSISVKITQCQRFSTQCIVLKSQ